MSIIKNTEELNNLLDAVQKLPVKKDEQEKVVDITENGTTVVTPDEGMTLGGVTVNVEVESGGGTEEIENLIDQSGVLGTTDETVTVTEKVEQLIDKASNFTAGFTSEKYKNWLEVNGFTLFDFTLTSEPTENFNIAHALGRPAKSIVCFRADLDGSVVDDRVCFAVSAHGGTADDRFNRLSNYSNTYLPFFIDLRLGAMGFRAILENTAEHVQFRHINQPTSGAVWKSGKYYMALL